MLLPTRVELVRGRRLPFRTPVFLVANQRLRTVDFLRHFPDCLHWKLIETTDFGFIMTHYNDTLELTTQYFNVMFLEWSLWLRYYFPRFSLRGKIVLDVGAGCGETVHFYQLKGAAKVIAIEPNPKAANHLRKNATVNRWNVEILEEAFELRHLDLPHDFMKMDIEGHEDLLLASPDRLSLKPCVIEVHTEELIQKLQIKYRMCLLHRMAHGIALLGA